MSIIDISDLTFSYEDTSSGQSVFEGLDLKIEEGEFVCVIGDSGCGKSTLLSILAGLRLPDSGNIMIGGKPMTGPGKERAIVFQHYSLFPWMSAEKNVIFSIKQTQKGLSKAEISELADMYLKKVGMYGERKKYPFQLSGGMQQRVALARALATDAEILLLDEPFGALDTKRRVELQQLLEQLWCSGTEKKTVVFVTHDIDEAVLLADRIIYMSPGRIEADIRVDFARPRKRDEMAGSYEFEELKKKLTELFYFDFSMEKEDNEAI